MRPLLTIGHSTRSQDEFIGLLQAHGVQCLVDVRTVPRSRRNPQFNREALPGGLLAAGIRYIHLPGLGGLRHPRKDSVNTGWNNSGFRGFADYMQTPEFEGSLNAVLEIAQQGQTALMCAEAVPWRCHRSLIADALVARGLPVEHLTGPNRRSPHQMTSFARIENNRITYPAPLLE